MPQLIGLAAFGSASVSGLTVFGVGLTTATGALTLAGSALSLAGSLLLNAAASALLAPDQQAISQDLRYPDALPPYRYVYGHTRAACSPIGYTVKQPYIYGCWLVNSRPSEGNFTYFLDERAALVSGDPHDFSTAGGAIGTTYPFLDHVKFWVGLGDQTTVPAEILAEAPWVSETAEDLFQASDVGRGRTVIWARFNRGADGQRNERWRNAPPIIEVEGDFSKVWDMRDPAQDPDDAETWGFTRNHALITLDAYRTNPFNPYEDRNLILPLWEDAADVSDEDVPLKAGGTEKRYELSGTLVFSGTELEDLTAPLLLAGAAKTVRVGGKLGIVPGRWEDPVYELTDILGQMSFDKIADSELPPTQLRVKYTSAARGYEEADLQPWNIPGALAEDGGRQRVASLRLDWVDRATQAMRVRKIEGLRLRDQVQLAGEAPPSAFRCIGGSVVDVNLPAPFGRMNRTYRVMQCDPAFDALGESGVGMRVPMVLRGETAAIYDWTPAIDEEDVSNPIYNGERQSIGLPGALSVVTDSIADLDTGDTIIARVQVLFDPADDPVTGYTWEYRQGGGAWQSGGAIDAEIRDNAGKVFFHLPYVSPVAVYDFRVRTTSTYGYSEWIYVYGVGKGFAITAASAGAGLGHATFSGTAPTSTAFDGVRIYRGAVGDDFDTAVLVQDLVVLPQGAAFTVDVGDPTTVDLIANGGFDADTDWTKGVGWTISGGTANKASGGAARLTQTPALTGGLNYRFGFEVSGRTAGDVKPVIVGGGYDTGADASSDGVFTDAVLASSGPLTIGMVSNAAFDGSVDDVAVFAETPNCLAQGRADYWIEPVTKTLSGGPPAGPFTLTII